MFVIFKLIKARACWREQDDIARLRDRCGLFDGAFDRSGAFDRDCVAKIRGDLFGGGANQYYSACPLAKGFAQNCVRTALVLTA